jgi:hypothetical protein
VASSIVAPWLAYEPRGTRARRRLPLRITVNTLGHDQIARLVLPIRADYHGGIYGIDGLARRARGWFLRRAINRREPGAHRRQRPHWAAPGRRRHRGLHGGWTPMGRMGCRQTSGAWRCFVRPMPAGSLGSSSTPTGAPRPSIPSAARDSAGMTGLPRRGVTIRGWGQEVHTTTEEVPCDHSRCLAEHDVP